MGDVVDLKGKSNSILNKKVAEEIDARNKLIEKEFENMTDLPIHRMPQLMFNAFLMAKDALKGLEVVIKKHVKLELELEELKKKVDKGG